jgi:hypothetical protein
MKNKRHEQKQCETTASGLNAICKPPGMLEYIEGKWYCIGEKPNIKPQNHKFILRPRTLKQSKKSKKPRKTRNSRNVGKL